MNKTIPDLMLEQYLLGELGESDRAYIEELLQHDRLLIERIEKLRGSSVQFSEKYPVNWFVNKIVNIKKTPYESTFWKPILVPVLCVLLLVPFGVMIFSKLKIGAESERAKGSVHMLTAYRKTELGHELLQDGAVVHAADLLQLEYTVADSTLYGLIISIDGNKEISIHMGTEQGESVQLAACRSMLPFSYQLDNAPECEKFFLVTSKKKFRLNDCISTCKEMNRRHYTDRELSITRLVLNKASLPEDSQ